MIEPSYRWGIALFWSNAPGGFLTGQTYRTRAEAIASYNAVYGRPVYRRDRRRGEVRAVRVVVSVFGQDAQP